MRQRCSSRDNRSLSIRSSGLASFNLGRRMFNLARANWRSVLSTTQGASLAANSKVLSLRGYLFAKLGRTNEALQVLNTLEAIARDRYVPPYAMAQIHLGLGDGDLALEWP